MAEPFLVRRDAAEEVLAALGLQGVPKYPDAKIADKLEALHKTKGAEVAVKSKLTGDQLATAMGVMDACRAGRKIALTPVPSGESVPDEETFSIADAGDAEVEEVEEVEPQPEETPVTEEVTTAAPPKSPKPVAKPAAKPTVKPAAPAPKGNPEKPAAKPTAKPTAKPVAKPAAPATANGKPAPKTDASPAEKKERQRDPAGLDAFGSKLGSRAARINAVVTETPKSAKQIQQDAKYDKPPQNHLRWMVEHGWAVLVKGEGYKLTAKGLKARGQTVSAKKPAPAKPAAKAKK